METKAFFGENGLTSTSANYIANIAKEFYTNLEKRLNSVKFYDETVAILGNATENTLSKGWTSTNLATIELALKGITSAKSLIAFLREAMKEKDRLYAEAKAYRSPEKDSLDEPKKEAYLTEEDIIKTWTIGEQEKYLSLETECAVLGKFIHQDGALNKARKDLETKISNPCELTNSVRDTILRRYTPCVDPEEVESLFFKLQSQHREKQAELNGLKHKIEEAIKKDTLSKDTEYLTALREYQRRMREISAEETLKRQELTDEVQALRIVIPNNLKDIYDTISHLAK